MISMTQQQKKLETYKIKCPVVFLKLISLQVSLEGQESLPPPLPVLVLACELVHVPPALDRFRSQDIPFVLAMGQGERERGVKGINLSGFSRHEKKQNIKLEFQLIKNMLKLQSFKRDYIFNTIFFLKVRLNKQTKTLKI